MNIGTWTITDAQGRILSGPEQTQFDLGATGLNEILQNVRVIINTRIGTVMLDRRFGLDFSFLDAPQNKAQLMMVQQMCQGLTMFEPRVTFAGIQFSPDLSSPGVMNVLLSVNIDQSELILPSS
jgi:uncharacterized protein